MTMSSTAQLRKIKKPLIERRRRERINDCLQQLKSIILEYESKEPSRYSKMEKADILEMTVRHIRQMHRMGQPIPEQPHHHQHHQLNLHPGRNTLTSSPNAQSPTALPATPPNSLDTFSPNRHSARGSTCSTPRSTLSTPPSASPVPSSLDSPLRDTRIRGSDLGLYPSSTLEGQRVTSNLYQRCISPRSGQGVQEPLAESKVRRDRDGQLAIAHDDRETNTTVKSLLIPERNILKRCHDNRTIIASHNYTQSNNTDTDGKLIYELKQSANNDVIRFNPILSVPHSNVVGRSQRALFLSFSHGDGKPAEQENPIRDQPHSGLPGNFQAMEIQRTSDTFSRVPLTSHLDSQTLSMGCKLDTQTFSLGNLQGIPIVTQGNNRQGFDRFVGERIPVIERGGYFLKSIDRDVNNNEGVCQDLNRKFSLENISDNRRENCIVYVPLNRTLWRPW